VRECSGEHACVITCCVVNELIDGVGRWTPLFKYKEGAHRHPLGWNRHLYGRDTPVQCVGAFSLITH
jgi:hypothetical protein